MNPPAAPPLLEIAGLTKHYPLRGGLIGALSGERRVLRAVDGIDLRLFAGEIVAIVGESGSGKTTTGKLVTLQEKPSGGSIRFEGEEITALAGAARKTYLARVQMIFQNPYEALDPRHTVLQSVMEPLDIHGDGDAAGRRARAEALLEQVELKPAAAFSARFPADLSGGQLQRVAIARALIIRPKLVVADEPVSMLDVSVRAGVMRLMLALSAEMGLASLYITHDLAVARAMSSRIAVMYLGAIVEEGPTEVLITHAAHPYTRLLVAAVPEHRANARRARVKLAGEAQALTRAISGCRFAPRCPRAAALCRDVPPPKVQLEGGHWSACHFAAEVYAG